MKRLGEFCELLKQFQLDLSSNFISNIHDIYGPAGKAWLKNLSDSINHLSKLWDFQFLNSMPILSYNYVGLVKMKRTGETAILKISPPGGNLQPEVKWLKCVEKGAPEIYQYDEDLNAYLMEHLDPGHSLKGMVSEGNDDEATRIICATIRNLHTQHCPKKDFLHLSELSNALDHLDGKFDANLLSKARSLFHELTLDRSGDVILHGDLHHDNILACESGWKAIDPHGYVGDPAAEVGAMIRNAVDCFPSHYQVPKIVERRLSILNDELPFGAEKIKSWAFCLTALSGAWSIKDHGTLPDSKS